MTLGIGKPAVKTAKQLWPCTRAGASPQPGQPICQHLQFQDTYLMFRCPILPGMQRNLSNKPSCQGRKRISIKTGPCPLHENSDLPSCRVCLCRKEVMKRKKCNHSTEIKVKTAWPAIQDRLMMAERVSTFDLHTNQVMQWKYLFRAK